MDKTTYLGVGLYSYPMAAHILGVKSSTLRRWVTEYTDHAKAKRQLNRPIITRYFSPEQRILSFLELVELHFVKLFRAEGVSMLTIRRASARAAQMFDTAYPFAVQRFDTDGKAVFASLISASGSTCLVEDLSRGQLAFERVVKPFFRRLDYFGDADALTLWPRERGGRVVLDPQRSLGKPMDAETGVLTSVLTDAVSADGGHSILEVANWYEVPIEAVEAAVAYERTLIVA